jgi:hypothetical protein
MFMNDEKHQISKKVNVVCFTTFYQDSATKTEETRDRRSLERYLNWISSEYGS